jgi:UDP-glucuronate decarboxylase
MVVRLVKSRSKLEFRSLPADDPKQRRPDIALAKTRLDWSPTVTLDKGLPTTIEYFRHLPE